MKPVPARTHGFTFLCAAAGLALALPRGAAAGCAVAEGDFDANGALDLRLSGDEGPQNALVELRGAGYLARIDADGNGSYADAADVVGEGPGPVETFTFDLGGGDTITVLQTGDLAGAAKNLVASFGGGANRFTFRSQRFALLGGSSLAFEIRGGDGNDDVLLDFSGGAIEDSLVVVRGDLGEGTNGARMVCAARTTHSVVDVSLTLGAARGGAAGSCDDGGGVVSDSTVRVRFRGADGDKASDTVSTLFSGRIEGRSRVDVDARLMRGNDRYEGRFDGSTFGVDAAGEMTLSVQGGNGFDALKVDGLAGAAAIDGTLAVDLDGGAQPDALDVVWRGITGGGRFRCRADGGSANDAITAAIRADPASANSLWLQFSGAAEEDISPYVGDVLNVAVDAPPAVTYGPLGGVIVDGGLQGDDTCNVTGTARHVTIGCERIGREGAPAVPPTLPSRRKPSDEKKR